MDVSKNRGKTPQNVWFIMENPMNKWMIWGVLPPLFLVQHPSLPTQNNSPLSPCPPQTGRAPVAKVSGVFVLISTDVSYPLNRNPSSFMELCDSWNMILLDFCGAKYHSSLLLWIQFDGNSMKNPPWIGWAQSFDRFLRILTQNWDLEI